MQGYLFIDEPIPSSWNRQYHRLGVCMAISTVGVLLIIAAIELPFRHDLARLVPRVLDVTLRSAPEAREPAIRPSEVREPEARPSEQPEERPLPDPATPAASTSASAPVATAAPREVAVEDGPSAETRIDWYAALERAAADVIARVAEEPQSMDPAFDELRRIAATRYAEPRTGKPQASWEAEKDMYGRTLLRRGNSYQILDDPSLTNRYAFETFERYMVFFSLTKHRPRNLPWVESIRARYAYMREPDELPILKTAVTGVQAN